MRIVISISRILVVVLLCGCATSHQAPNTQQDAEKLTRQFQLGLVDFRAIHGENVAALFPVIGSYYTVYWLPASIEPVINAGTNAMPILSESQGSKDLVQRELATACIRLIQAKRLEKGKLQKDAKSGMEFLSYTLLR